MSEPMNAKPAPPPTDAYVRFMGPVNAEID